MSRLRATKGFTLVELLTVLAITAILTLVAIEILSTQANTDANTQTKTLLRNASSILNTWLTDPKNPDPGTWLDFTPANAGTLSQDSSIVWASNSDYLTAQPNECTESINWTAPTGDNPLNVCITISGPATDTTTVIDGNTVNNGVIDNGSTAANPVYSITLSAESKTGEIFCVGEQTAAVSSGVLDASTSSAIQPDQEASTDSADMSAPTLTEDPSDSGDGYVPNDCEDLANDGSGWSNGGWLESNTLTQ